jgi:hypothetical protein
VPLGRSEPLLREIANRSLRTVHRRVDDRSGAERGCCPATGFRRLGDDDDPGTCCQRALQDAEADRTGTEHHHRRAEHRRGAPHGVDGDSHRLGERGLHDAESVGDHECGPT